MFLDTALSTRRSDARETPARVSEFKGADIYVVWRGRVSELIAELNKAAVPTMFRLEAVYNGGDQIWPAGRSKAQCEPIWQCRFLPMFRPGDHAHAIPELLGEISKRLHWTQVDRLERYTKATIFVDPDLEIKMTGEGA